MPALRLSDTTMPGTPPRNAKARACAPIQSTSVCVRVADSFDLRVGATEAQRVVMERKCESGRYFGEMDLVFEYDGQ